MWKPLQEQHAISKALVRLAFSEPFPARGLHRLLNEAEGLAVEAGLTQRQDTRSVEINVDQKLETAGLGHGPINGAFFDAHASAVEEDGLNRVRTERLQVTSQDMTYSTWNYASWSSTLSRVQELLLPLADLAATYADLTLVRLEYRDRFWFDGDAEKSRVADLLREDCQLLPSHIFHQADLWHAHTGAFVDSAFGKLLMQTNVDARDLKDEEDPEISRRWINIMTAYERRIPPTNIDEVQSSISEEGAAQADEYSINSELDTMHANLKILISSIISAEMAEAISLHGKNDA